MPDVLMQLGVGGIVALLVIREVLGFLNKRKENGQKKERVAGEMSPEFWQADYRKAVTEVVASIVVPILASQTSILSEMQRSNQDVSQKIAIILDRLSRQHVET